MWLAWSWTTDEDFRWNMGNVSEKLDVWNWGSLDFSHQLVTNLYTPREVEAGKEIIFTYDVGFEESGCQVGFLLGHLPVNDRWSNSLVFHCELSHDRTLLSGMVAMIMLRTPYRDISGYSQLDIEEEAQEETGWKLVHGDVFRPPVNYTLCLFNRLGLLHLYIVDIACEFVM